MSAPALPDPPSRDDRTSRADAGAAKTSIYRHWPSVEDLLIDALGHALPAERVTVDGGELRADLLRSLDQLARWLDGPALPEGPRT